MSNQIDPYTMYCHNMLDSESVIIASPVTVKINIYL